MSSRLAALIASAIMILASTSHAAVSAIDFPTPSIDFTIGQYSLGFSFIANQDLSVTQLGFYDDLQNGLTESHTVGIFDVNQVLLGSTTVVNGDPLIGWFRYANVSPISLVSGSQYWIAATTGTENYTWDPATYSVDPAITYQGDRFTQSATLVFPSSGPSIGFGYFGPNFQFAAVPVPQPGTLALLALSLAGLAGMRRRKQ